MDDEFWIYDPHLLIRPDRLIEFYPTIDMSPNEKLNSICRFILYAGFILSFIKKKAWPVAISIVFMISTSLLHEKEGTIMKNIGKSSAKMNKYDENFDESEEKWIYNPTCRKKTTDNPYGNPMPTDYKLRHSLGKETCTENNILISKNTNDPFGKDFDRFYTIPGSSVPNDRSSIEDSLRRERVCKDGDSSVCTGF
tara:strand:- start:2526 stop:3113 length:588 start_codon:yes stop_codon:yes gene_type:complete